MEGVSGVRDQVCKKDQVLEPVKKKERKIY